VCVCLGSPDGFHGTQLFFELHGMRHELMFQAGGAHRDITHISRTTKTAAPGSAGVKFAQHAYLILCDSRTAEKPFFFQGAN
jgi:hypothetical protein